jgi:hypothetical protein
LDVNVLNIFLLLICFDLAKKCTDIIKMLRRNRVVNAFHYKSLLSGGILQINISFIIHALKPGGLHAKA